MSGKLLPTNCPQIVSKIAVAAAMLLFFSTASAAEPKSEPADLPRIQMVLLTPADVAPPPGHRRRLTRLALYTEKFLGYWMNRWGYPPGREQIFDRNPDGSVVIRHVRGTRPAASGTYSRPPVMDEVYDIAIPQYDIPHHLHYWWVHVYAGPGHEFTGYRGTGNSKNGGNATVRYSAAPGSLNLHQPILAGFHKEYHLKGVIHEFGHALGLPHVGPRQADRAGTTLMGPNFHNWERVTGEHQPRGYLSESSAAMLWKHPILSGSTKDRQVMPKVDVSDFTVPIRSAPRAGPRQRPLGIGSRGPFGGGCR